MIKMLVACACAVTMLGLAPIARSRGMQLRSVDFTAGSRLPGWSAARECGGNNVSPELHWSTVPRGANEFVLVINDGDAPVAGGFYHWVVYRLDSATRRLPRGVRLPARELGTNSAGTDAYFGPCPPSGPPHHYTFSLYALDGRAAFVSGAPLTGARLETELRGHILAKAVLVGTWGR